MTVYLTTEQLLYFGGAACGAPVIVRDLGLVESALARPQASVFGDDAYPDVWTKAAALYQSLARNHPFVDGNKRVALAAGPTRSYGSTGSGWRCQTMTP